MLVVDPVDDAEQPLLAGLQHTFQAVPKLRRLNLAGVGGTDGVEQIRVHDTAFQEIHLPEELQPIRGVLRPRKAGPHEFHCRKDALIAHIMDRKQGAAGSPPHVGMVQSLEKYDGK